ncbi:hypothetical protein B0H66DRAFT_549882 [Apodospora peruviana]|uniref:Uncharacterized protein n=1 Tax=Apodospora peruviana TaxID=516989 RepID=A0AAE0IJ31_9PEZI|nr:hypothetical protein B0H66DRAFT_549882 [Apodospora peruviana]
MIAEQALDAALSSTGVLNASVRYSKYRQVVSSGLVSRQLLTVAELAIGWGYMICILFVCLKQLSQRGGMDFIRLVCRGLYTIVVKSTKELFLASLTNIKVLRTINHSLFTLQLLITFTKYYRRSLVGGVCVMMLSSSDRPQSSGGPTTVVGSVVPRKMSTVASTCM